MATQHLDLEEQEQLDQIKAFWRKWGNAITWFLIVILGSYAAYNGWQLWQNRKAQKAAALYDQVTEAAPPMTWTGCSVFSPIFAMRRMALFCLITRS